MKLHEVTNYTCSIVRGRTVDIQHQVGSADPLKYLVPIGLETEFPKLVRAAQHEPVYALDDAKLGKPRATIFKRVDGEVHQPGVWIFKDTVGITFYLVYDKEFGLLTKAKLSKEIENAFRNELMPYNALDTLISASVYRYLDALEQFKL